ncbi:hypothetical protein ACFXA9_12380, partial [Streptomyces sp. NPDC059411]
MKIALMDSGIGLLAAAAAMRRLRPDAELVLSCDPDGMPWGPRTPQDLAGRAVGRGRGGARGGPAGGGGGVGGPGGRRAAERP